MSKFRTPLSLWPVAICCLLISVRAPAEQTNCDDAKVLFHEQPIGTTSTEQIFSEINYTNIPGGGPLTPMTITSITINDPANPPPSCGDLTHDYVVGGTCAVGLVLMPGESCAVSITFTPQALGPRNMIVVLRSDLDERDVPVTGTGVTSDFTRPTKPVVEYVNASLNQYVITSAPNEIAALDAGAIKGWVRTGASFNGLSSDPNLLSVCRYYAVTASAATHWYFFYGPYRCGWFELSLYAPRLVDWVQEDPDVFNLVFTSPNGWCPYATTQLYGLWDRIIGHRYTIDPTIRANMIAQGWLAEGYGPGVVACVSQ
jgi:hypothetical protein